MELAEDNSIPKYKWELKRPCFDRLEAIASLAIRGEPTAREYRHIYILRIKGTP